MVALIKPLETRLQKLLDKIFRKDITRYRHNYSIFNYELQTYLGLSELLVRVKKFINKNYLVEEVVCFRKNESGNYFNNSNRDEIIPLTNIEAYINFFISEKRSIELYELEVKDANSPLLNILKKKKVELILPLVFQSEILGFIFLSKKRYDNKFSEDELERLTILANEVVIAYHRNKIFAELEAKKDEQFKLEKLAAIGQMTAGVAHEIKNPLNTISVSAQTLRKGSLNREENFELMDYIVKEVDRLDNLLKDFLKLSKTIDIKIETVEVGTLFSKTITAVETKNNNHIKIKCDCQKRIFLRTDPGLLYQVLLNLGLNSIDAIKERCKKDEIFNCPDGLLSFSTENLSDKILIKIQDNGTGIPEEKLNTIFNPFFTTKEEGTGLGLSIAHNIITNLGGTISVNSFNNKTEFSISFPKT